MSEACAALGIPVIGGNVSFYNESQRRDIDPTPVVGVLGLDRRARRAAAAARARAGERDRACSARPRPSSAARSGRRSCTASTAGRPPAADLDAARRAARRSSRDLVAERDRRRACTTAPTAGSRSRWPRWRSAASVGFARRSPRPAGSHPRCSGSPSRRHGSCCRWRPSASTPSSDRGGAAGRSPRPTSATAGGDRLVAAGAFDVALADATRGWRDAIPDAPRPGCPRPARQLAEELLDVAGGDAP